MKLSLKNICNIQTADIEIDGITVIAGPNNTGKSTIGKSLYFMFRNLYNFQDTIDSAKRRGIAEVLYRHGLKSNNHNIVNSLLKKKEIFEKDIQNFEKYLRENCAISKYSIHIDNDILNFNDDNSHFEGGVDFKKLAIKIQEILLLSDKEYLQAIINRNIETIFSGAICGIYANTKSEISLTIKEQKNIFYLKNNKISENSKVINLSTAIVYCDDPFIIDMEPMLIKGMMMNQAIRGHLIGQLYQEKDVSFATQIITEKKLEEILSLLNSICSGELSRKRSILTYKEKNSDKELPVQLLSTGIKSFLILKKLLLNGTLVENGTLILDEPEVHLHPEWQLVYAQLIVLLQKKFNLHILLATHSPYFLEAIEEYSKKYDIATKCKYYLADTERDNDLKHDFFVFTDVSDNLELLYKKFAMPYQKLETLSDENSDDVQGE